MSSYELNKVFDKHIACVHFTPCIPVGEVTCNSQVCLVRELIANHLQIPMKMLPTVWKITSDRTTLLMQDYHNTEYNLDTLLEGYTVVKEIE